MQKKDRLLSAVLPIFSVGLIVVLWIISAVIVGDGMILPSIEGTFVALIDLLKSAKFYTALLSTLLRSFVAFVISYALAFITALLSYKYKTAKRLLVPVITIVRTLPTIAVVLLLVVWTNSKVAPVIVTTLVVFPTLLSEFTVAFSGIDGKVLTMCEVFKVSRRDRLFKVILPTLSPSLISAVGFGFTLNLKLMVAAEVLSSTARSLGYLMNKSYIYFETATLTALVLITLIIGLVVDGVFSILSKKAGKFL